MGRILAVGLLVLTVLVGCSSNGMSATDVGETVKHSMQKSMDTDPKYTRYDLTIDKVTAVKAEGNTYQGIAAVSSRTGTHDVIVQITADGDNVVWKTEPGAFLFLAQEG